MNTIEKKRQFLKYVISGKKKVEDFDPVTFDQKKLCLEMVSNENLEWIIFLYSKYGSQIKNDVLSTSILNPEELTKYKEIQKQFIYK